MIFSRQLRYVYLPMPKAASTTICDILARDYDGACLPGSDRHENIIPEEFSAYFCFTSVRHPYERGISAYNYINRRRTKPLPVAQCKDSFHFMSMLEYLQTPLVMRTFASIYDTKTTFALPLPPGFQLARPQYFIRVESLREDFEKLPFVNRGHEYPCLNKSLVHAGNTEQVKKFIRQAHAMDFTTFGYTP